MLKIKTPTLRIHCWGGLGSQLQALCYYLKIKERHPERKIVLVLHTGGVTERKSEIDFLRNKVNIFSVLDYSQHLLVTDNSKSKKLNFIRSAKKFSKYLLNSLRIVITNDKDTVKILPWTYEVRSSYSNIKVDKNELLCLWNLLSSNTFTQNYNSIGVHFRHGDLAAKKSSSLIDFEVIAQIISYLKSNLTSPNSVVVYSDSKQDMFSSILNFEIDYKNIETLQTIFELVHKSTFIGTNSKVTLWIMLFRWALSIPCKNYLPLEIANKFLDMTRIDNKTIKKIFLENTHAEYIEISL